MRIFQFFTLAIISISISCAQEKNTSYDMMLNLLLSNSVEQIKVDQLKNMMEKSDIILLDTREEREYEVSHIDGAKHVGYDHFKKSKVKDLPKDKAVVLYCSVGYRSEKIGEKLKKMGFENVKNLRGGVFEWKNRGNAVVGPDGNKTERVHAYDKKWGIWLKNAEKVYE